MLMLLFVLDKCLEMLHTGDISSPLGTRLSFAGQSASGRDPYKMTFEDPPFQELSCSSALFTE